MRHFIPFMVVLMLCGCSASRSINYLQDIEMGTEITPLDSREIKIKKGDKLSIIIKSKEAQLADLFNLPIVAHRVGGGESSSISNNQEVSLYTVDNGGEIDFPFVGKIHIEGKSRLEVAEFVKIELIKRNLINDLTVTVEYANLYISVLGEVNKPGRYIIEQDRLSLPDALGLAGDLTIYGRRDNILVMRREGDRYFSYRVNITSGKELFRSPAFFLQQGDIIYVEPNVVRARQSTVNGNNVLSTSFWISLASLIASLAVIFKR